MRRGDDAPGRPLAVRLTELLPRDADEEARLAAVRFHGVVGHLNGAPGWTKGALEALANGALYAHLRSLSDIDALQRILDVPWLVVKGPIAAAWQGGLGRRPFSDLDVLVRPEEFPAALEQMEDAGAEPLVRTWAEQLRERSGELPLRLPDGGIVDLHWSVFAEQDVRAAFRVPDLFGASVTTELAGREVLTLGVADTLIHLGLHTMLSGCDRLIWLVDIDRFIASRAIDWAAVAGRADDWGAGLVLATALGRCRDLLDTPVDDTVLTRLAGGRAWLRLDALVRRASPVERHDGRASLGRIVARSTRSTWGASARELGRRSRRWSTEPLRRLRATPTGPSEHRAKAAYLDAVTRYSGTASLGG